MAAQSPRRCTVTPRRHAPDRVEPRGRPPHQVRTERFSMDRLGSGASPTRPCECHETHRRETVCGSSRIGRPVWAGWRARIDRHRSPSIAIDRSVGRPAGDEADLPRGPSGVRGLRNSPRSHAPARVCRSAVPLARLGEGPAWRRGKPSIRDLDESCRATKQLPSHPFFGPLLDPLRPPRPRRVRWFVRRGGVLLPRAGGARHGRPEPRWLDRRR